MGGVGASNGPALGTNGTTSYCSAPKRSSNPQTMKNTTYQTAVPKHHLEATAQQELLLELLEAFRGPIPRQT